MRYREIAARLKDLGCEEIPRKTQGSHRIWHNPRTGRIAPLPDWGSKDIKMGTLRAFLRQLGIDWDEFQKR
ncbi:MAG: type II toxin-antitoxin system HicA family toxin [Roseiflexaceae bacterium]|nr:type II toxin-antitoxin system HicA family toxin [Roseiflexaceae bacterium]